MECSSGVKEYKVYGSRVPKEKALFPQIFFHVVFARNEIVARSKFNNLLRTRYKIKSTESVILKIEEVAEDLKEMKVKNYGIQFVYRSRRALHNMYKEFRAVSRSKAVEMLFCDMAGRHRAKSSEIKIVSLKELSLEEMRRDRVIEFAQEGVMYPVFKKELNCRKAFVPEGTDVFN